MKKCVWFTILAVVAIGLSTPAGAQTKITIGYTGANAFLAAFVAKDQGFFQKRGLDVILLRLPVGSTIPAAIMGDSLQIGTLTPPVFIQAVEGGLPLQIVAAATLQTKDNITAGVVARAAANIAGPGDFRGKKVGVPGLNGVQHVMFMKWLTDRGIDPKQVTFIETAFPQMGDLLKAAQIDAALPVEPFLARIKDSKAGALVANYTAEVAASYLESFYAAKKEWIDANPKAVTDFRAALNDALSFIQNQTEEAKKSQIVYLGLSPQIVATLPLPTLVTEVEPEQVRYWIDLTKNFGVTKGTTTVEQLIAR